MWLHHGVAYILPGLKTVQLDTILFILSVYFTIGQSKWYMVMIGLYEIINCKFLCKYININTS